MRLVRLSSPPAAFLRKKLIRGLNSSSRTLQAYSGPTRAFQMPLDISRLSFGNPVPAGGHPSPADSYSPRRRLNLRRLQRPPRPQTVRNPFSVIGPANPP